MRSAAALVLSTVPDGSPVRGACRFPVALVSCFGPDDCYGIAWSLLHLIESAPNPVLVSDPGPDSNEWHQRLHLRAVNGGLVP